MILQEIDFMIDQVRKDEKSHLADIFDNLDKERRTLTIRPNACSVLCDFVQIGTIACVVKVVIVCKVDDKTYMSEPQYGYSLRHRSDLFDVHVGQRIALKRALCDLSSSMNVPSVYTIAEALTRSSRWMASKTNGRIPLHKYIYNFYRNQYPLIPFHSRKEDENEHQTNRS